MPISRTGSRRGFTLLEVMVAMTLGAMLMTASYGVFSVAVQTSKTVETHSDRMQRFRYVFSSLRRDLLNSATVSAMGRDKISFNENNLAVFTLDDAGRQWFVDYALKDGALIRSARLTGVTPPPAPEVNLLGTGVSKCDFRYLGKNGWEKRLRTVWPKAVRMELGFRNSEREPERMYSFTVAVMSEASEARAQ
jgi:prepilin-type N-terminal cleavage/methylation domain-containing protein